MLIIYALLTLATTYTYLPAADELEDLKGKFGPNAGELLPEFNLNAPGFHMPGFVDQETPAANENIVTEDIKHRAPTKELKFTLTHNEVKYAPTVTFQLSNNLLDINFAEDEDATATADTVTATDNYNRVYKTKIIEFKETPYIFALLERKNHDGLYLNNAILVLPAESNKNFKKATNWLFEDWPSKDSSVRLLRTDGTWMFAEMINELKENPCIIKLSYAETLWDSIVANPPSGLDIL